jgi:hypothetical protein
MKWAYAVTTCVQRRKDLLPRTLASLRAAGFDKPRLFVDGDKDALSWEREFGLEVTARYPTIRTYGNWVLALAELYIRNPSADRYFVAQDDFTCYRNLRQYLERCKYPEKGYLNCYTFPSNQIICPKDAQGRPLVGWYPSNQLGRGAVALVFDRLAVQTLLRHQHMVERPTDAHRGHRAIDGGIVTAFAKAGWKEYCHNPSLTQHIGDVSSMGNKPHKKAISFRGESFDALELLAR